MRATVLLFPLLALGVSSGTVRAADRLVPWFPGTVVIDSAEQNEAEKEARERALQDRRSKESSVLQRLLPAPFRESKPIDPERKLESKPRKEIPPALQSGPTLPGQVQIDSAEQADAERKAWSRSRALDPNPQESVCPAQEGLSPVAPAECAPTESNGGMPPGR